ncbi:MAG: hypothetical protein R3F39_14110 [Myxococcota bacterium]
MIATRAAALDDPSAAVVDGRHVASIDQLVGATRSGRNSVRAELVRRIATLVPPQRDASTEAVLEHIAALASETARRWCDAHGQALEFGLSQGLPIPVLTAAGVAASEVGWTQYLKHVLDPAQEHGLGQIMGQILLDAWTGCEHSPDEDVHVRAEVALGADCPDCDHSGVVDLVVMSPRAILVVEQKVRSGKSNWSCGTCLGDQLKNYEGRIRSGVLESQFHAWFGGMPSPRAHLVYLTPGGRDGGSDDWKGRSHRELADALWQARDRVKGVAARYSLLALLVDLNGPEMGAWREIMHSMRIVFQEDPTLDRGGSAIRLVKLANECSLLCDVLLEASRWRTIA